MKISRMHTVALIVFFTLGVVIVSLASARELEQGDTVVNCKGWYLDDNGTSYCEAIQPEIIFTKTVGLDPAICATTDEIALPETAGGIDVTYCYKVQNTGNISFTSHTIVDDQLGEIYTDIAFNLTPDSAAFVTSTATITQTTVNSATWTASNGDQIAAANDTASVVVSPTTISMKKTVGLDPAICATTDTITVPVSATPIDVTYCYAVQNNGSISLTNHDLVDDQLGQILNNFPYNLAPSASIFVTSTATLSRTTVNTAIWTASNGDQIAEASGSAAVIIESSVYLPIVLKD